MVGAPVEDRLETTESSTEDFSEGFVEGVEVGVDVGVGVGVDVGVEVRGTRLGVELGVVEDAVVDGGTGGDVLDVEGVTATGGACTTLGLMVGVVSAGGVVDESGALPTGVCPPPGLELLLKKDSGRAPYTGASSEHGSVGHTAVTRAQWVKRMHRMPKGNRVGICILSTGDRVLKLEEDLIAGLGLSGLHLTSVVYASEILKRRLEVIMHESACHRIFNSRSIQSSMRSRMTSSRLDWIPKAGGRHKSRDNADCMRSSTHNQAINRRCGISKKKPSNQQTNKEVK